MPIPLTDWLYFEEVLLLPSNVFIKLLIRFPMRTVAKLVSFSLYLFSISNSLIIYLLSAGQEIQWKVAMSLEASITQTKEGVFLKC